MIVCLVGRGTYYKLIIRDTNDKVISKIGPADVIYNWGMAGSRFSNWEARKAKWIKDKPIFNRPINNTKWTQLCKVSKAGVPILKSTRDRSEIKVESQWLFKPDFSIGGRYIQMANDYPPPTVSGYYQRFVDGADRKYELRVHACVWRDKREFLVQKRVSDNPGAITWNHKTGGRFVTVNNPTKYRIFKEAQDYSILILDTLSMNSGGIDFIVNKEGEVYFLEVNFSLGLRLPATLGYWVDSFNKLTEGGIE